MSEEKDSRLLCYRAPGTAAAAPYGSCKSCGYFSGMDQQNDISRPSDCIECFEGYALVPVNYLCAAGLLQPMAIGPDGPHI